MNSIKKNIKSRENLFLIGFIFLFPYTMIIYSFSLNVTFKESWIAVYFNWKYYLALPLVYLLYFLQVIKLDNRNITSHFIVSMLIVMMFPILPMIQELLYNMKEIPILFQNLMFASEGILIFFFLIIQLVFILKSIKLKNSHS
ncbi:MAG: hypothetical protein EBR30_11580 [Cytophagia bacterium]|nr:hypothetical protein [Cytophagia bacterium]